MGDGDFLGSAAFHFVSEYAGFRRVIRTCAFLYSFFYTCGVKDKISVVPRICGIAFC